MNRTGRNDPCPCGSGKKYKHCCLQRTASLRGPEQACWNDLVHEMVRMVEGDKEGLLLPALREFWGELDPANLPEGYRETAAINFMEWAVLDFSADGKVEHTLPRILLASLRTQDPLKTVVLVKMTLSHLSLYEVQDVNPGVGLVVRDMLQEEEYEIVERTASRELVKWDVFAARIVELDGRMILSGSIYGIPPMTRRHILDDIRKEFVKFKGRRRKVGMAEFLKRRGFLFNRIWAQAILAPSFPDLVNTDGDRFIFGTAIYDVKDGAAVRKRLRTIMEYDKDDDDFVHLVEQTEGVRKGQWVLHARAVIRGRRLLVECNSKERLEKAKARIQKALGAAVVHRLDEFKSPQLPPDESGEEGGGTTEESKIPPEVTQEFYERFQKEHYERWLDMPIPALGGKTPMQAVKTKKGRAQVESLLRELENDEERNRRDGRPYFDPSWMRQRLGL